MTTALDIQASLKPQQLLAFEAISKFLAYDCPDMFFVLSGYAGTGKTYLLKALAHTHGAVDSVFCAPTNKATKVIERTLGQYNGVCKTIYSLLGVKMVAHEDKLYLEFPAKPVDLSGYSQIYLDESSMLNKQMLDYIKERSKYNRHTKWIFIGDKAQLPPVGEKVSQVWKLECPSAHLEDVVRFDNEILNFATHIRKLIQRYPHGELSIISDHSNGEGIWKYRRSGFIRNIRAAAKKGLFTEIDNTKVVAWRNRTVLEYNTLIRAEIFGTKVPQWVVGDRVTVSEPVKSKGVTWAHIDDEGTITSCGVAHHSYYSDVQAYHMTIAMDNGNAVTVNVVHEDYESILQEKLNDLAMLAKTKDKRYWKEFWVLHDSFHKIRHSYALTAHRAQGSTYLHAFIDTSDILTNQNTLESFKCLYVGCSRASSRIILT